MQKYWFITTLDNNIITEKDQNWEDISKDQIKSIALQNGQQTISLPQDMDEYGQGKTASASLGGNTIHIESRYIWGKKGNNINRIRIDEKSHNISLELENEH